jgi:Secretion system C-terminal sorting domain
MKKILLAFLLSTNYFLALAQAWQPCNLAVNNNSTGSTAMCVHNNKIFATNNHKGLQVSNDDGATWTVVNDSINWGSVFLHSTGNRLYAIQTNTGCALIRYSLDDGVSFIQDTNALPICYPNTPLRPSTAGYGATVSWNNHMMMSLAGPDWEFSRNTNDTTWVDVAYFDANDCSEFFVHNDTCWAATNGATSNGVAWSVDGINWTSPNSTGIPIYYVPTQIAWHNKRLFMMGGDVAAANAGVDTILKYSDDYGLTFQDKNIKQYLIKPNQATRDIYSANNHLYFTMANDINGSCADLLLSTDNGATFTLDTLGFPSEVNTIFEIVDMGFHNGWAFAQLNSGDLFRKKIGPTSIAENNLDNGGFEIYPNPTQKMLHIVSTKKIERIEILNLAGQILRQSSMQDIDISDLAADMYFVKIICTHEKTIYKKVIKH